MGRLKIKSLRSSFYLPSPDDNHLWETLILSLFALAREAQEEGRESEELPAMFSWLAGDPWQDAVSDVMRM